MRLRFRRHEAGVYFAQDETNHYTVRRDWAQWTLLVKELVTTADVQHAVGQYPICRDSGETKRLAVAVADAYSQIGVDYQEHEHRHRSRCPDCYMAVG